MLQQVDKYVLSDYPFDDSKLSLPPPDQAHRLLSERFPATFRCSEADLMRAVAAIKVLHTRTQLAFIALCARALHEMQASYAHSKLMQRAHHVDYASAQDSPQRIQFLSSIQAYAYTCAGI